MKLSKRQKEVSDLIAKGLSNREISEAMGIGEGTVKTHVCRVLKKLSLKNRTQITAHVLNKGI